MTYHIFCYFARCKYKSIVPETAFIYSLVLEVSGPSVPMDLHLILLS